jgi:hypothetical protein
MVTFVTRPCPCQCEEILGPHRLDGGRSEWEEQIFHSLRDFGIIGSHREPGTENVVLRFCDPHEVAEIFPSARLGQDLHA